MEIKRGGKRNGAGRKRGLASIKAEEARKYLVQRVADELEDILAGQIELAKGIYYETGTGEDIKRVYQKHPDTKVAEYLLNQLIGRPTEFSEIKIQEKPPDISPERKAKINRILGIRDDLKS